MPRWKFPFLTWCLHVRLHFPHVVPLTAMKLAQVRRFAMSLPDVTEEPHFNYCSFRVRGKIFATAPPEGEHLHVFVAEAERDMALALEPAFLEKLHWGVRVVGLRVTLANAKPGVVTTLLAAAWSRKAPKRLHATMAARAVRGKMPGT